MVLIYKENPKHRVQGDGPPRWYPDPDSLCPDDVDQMEAETLLRDSVSGDDASHPEKKARYAIDSQGRFFKGYTEGADANGECWHGFPVPEDKVRLQVPARVLKDFKNSGKLSSSRYKKLLGGAR